MTAQEPNASSKANTLGTVPKSAAKRRQPKGGSRKGIPNKVTKALKEMILGALDDAGGQRYLKEQAEKNPGPFMALVGKVLPTTLAGDPANPVKIEHALRPQLTPEQWLAAHGIKS